MLRRLKVENYALIDRLELELDDRLNIITGETGAGKSILLGALGLLLGNKNDNATLKDDKRNCLIEGVFDLGTRDLQAFFDRNDLDYSRETTLTRQITPAGKSRSFINDTPVPLALLRELGSQLIDIHSQHQNLILGSEAFRTQAVDTVAENHDLRMQYTTLYERLCHLRRELARLREEAEAGRKDEEWLRYQAEELTAARLRAGEVAELEAEQAVLGGILLRPQLLHILVGQLAPEDFYLPAHAVIFQAILDLYGKSAPIDLLSIAEQLKSGNRLEEAGGAVYLGELAQAVVSGANAEYYATIVRDKALQRGLIEACGRLDAPGRPSLYRTSALFLRTMGMQSLDELPVLPDLSSDEGAEKLEQAISELRGRGEQMELTDTEEKPTGE